MEDVWDGSATAPFWGTEEALRQLSDLVKHCVECVTKSASPREMVLESWLVVDSAVRDLLVSGYGLAQFCHEDFDIRYELLPGSFERLLKVLERTTRYQKSLGDEPTKRDDYPPYYQFSSLGFMRHLRENHPDILERLEQAEAGYLAERHPELTEQIEQQTRFYFMPPEERTPRLPRGWVEVATTLEDDWFQTARRLNKAPTRPLIPTMLLLSPEPLGRQGQRRLNWCVLNASSC